MNQNHPPQFPGGQHYPPSRPAHPPQPPPMYSPHQGQLYRPYPVYASAPPRSHAARVVLIVLGVLVGAPVLLTIFLGLLIYFSTLG